MTTTSSAHAAHCFCATNTGGQRCCCQCGAIYETPSPQPVVMKCQILRYWRGPEAFRFIRDEKDQIQQWDSFEAAEAAVKALLYEPEDVEHVIVTVHRAYKITTTYPKVDPVREIREYGLTS